jgi:thiamine-monophosphate kinase
MNRPTEDEIIADYFAPLAGSAGLGLMDDAAAFAPPSGQDLVVTKDMLCAGMHFFADDPPEAIARKALRVNLSDLAAKSATPLGFLLGLALPGDWTPDWLKAFAAGLGADAAAYQCPLIGGDTVKSPGALTISITALGSVPTGTRLVRSSVAENDFLYVSGTIGDSTLGLRSCWSVICRRSRVSVCAPRSEPPPMLRWTFLTGWPAISPKCCGRAA